MNYLFNPLKQFETIIYINFSLTNSVFYMFIVFGTILCLFIFSFVFCMFLSLLFYYIFSILPVVVLFMYKKKKSFFNLVTVKKKISHYKEYILFSFIFVLFLNWLFLFWNNVNLFETVYADEIVPNIVDKKVNEENLTSNQKVGLYIIGGVLVVTGLVIGYNVYGDGVLKVIKGLLSRGPNGSGSGGGGSTTEAIITAATGTETAATIATEVATQPEVTLAATAFVAAAVILKPIVTEVITLLSYVSKAWSTTTTAIETTAVGTATTTAIATAAAAIETAEVAIETAEVAKETAEASIETAEAAIATAEVAKEAAAAAIETAAAAIEEVVTTASSSTASSSTASIASSSTASTAEAVTIEDAEEWSIEEALEAEAVTIAARAAAAREGYREAPRSPIIIIPPLQNADLLAVRAEYTPNEQSLFTQYFSRMVYTDMYPFIRGHHRQFDLPNQQGCVTFRKVIILDGEKFFEPLRTYDWLPTPRSIYLLENIMFDFYFRRPGVGDAWVRYRDLFMPYTSEDKVDILNVQVFLINQVNLYTRAAGRWPLWCTEEWQAKMRSLDTSGIYWGKLFTLNPGPELMGPEPVTNASATS